MRRLLMVSTISRFLRDFLFPYAVHFRALGWQVDALTSEVDAYPECQEAFDHLWGIEWSRNPLDPRNLIRAPKSIRDLVEQQGYDIVHVHTPVAAFVTRYALRNRLADRRPQVIYTAHGFHFHPCGNPVKNRIFTALENVAGRWTDHLVVINKEDQDAAVQYDLVPKDRLVYMPGIGVDMDYYRPEAIAAIEIAAIRRALGVATDEQILLMVAEFNPGKRHRDALTAFCQLNRSDVHLVFAGDGPLVGEIQQLARTYGVHERVHFLGFRQDIPALVRAASATLLPSEREGLPRSVMESLCLEVPVIGTAIRGTRDLITEDCGILVPVGGVPQIMHAMEWILNHPREARIMGKHGRVHMRNFALDRVITLHEQLYAQALGDVVELREAA